MKHTTTSSLRHAVGLFLTLLVGATADDIACVVQHIRRRNNYGAYKQYQPGT